MRMSRMQRFIIGGAVIVAWGCGPARRPEPLRGNVSGTVTLDGKAVEQGRVIFKAVQDGLIDNIAVVNGEFAGKAVAGRRRVEFSVLKQAKVTGSPLPGDPEFVLQESLPKHLHAESTFTAEITEAGPNVMRFELSSESTEGRGEP